jgi:hypothetical protein
MGVPLYHGTVVHLLKRLFIINIIHPRRADNEVAWLFEVL